MSEKTWEKLYRAQFEEHDKTTARLRTVEKENAVLRGLIGSQQREYADAVSMLQGVATNIMKAFPNTTQQGDGE